MLGRVALLAYGSLRATIERFELNPERRCYAFHILPYLLNARFMPTKQVFTFLPGKKGSAGVRNSSS
jgi:hypothetical protein